MRMICRTLKSLLHSRSLVSSDGIFPLTTYQHTLTIGDGEYLALSDALKLMIEHCEAQMKAGEGAPYYAYRQHCNAMLDKLRVAPAQMTSTNNFFDNR